MKKNLLLFAFALGAITANAQDGLEMDGGFYWKYNDADKTATVISKERWHFHGEEQAFGNCHCYRDDVVIPDKAPNGYTVTAIGEGAFNSCDSLTSVTLPKTLKYIGELAFQLCEKLKEIRIPSSVEHLDHGCFNGAGLEKLYIEDSADPIKIGSSYMVYGSLFYGIDALRYAYVGRNFTVDNPSAEETEGPKGLFYACENIEEVYFSTNVTQLHEGEFWGCKNLKTASVGSISVIPNNCFENCESLTKMNCVTKLLEGIGNYAFANTTLLGKGITLNLDAFPNLTAIGEGAYMQSGAVKAVVPSKVQTVGDAAFGFMSDLTELHSLAVVPPTCSVFGPVSEDTYQTCNLYVPKGSVDAYKVADGWSQFKNIMPMIIKGDSNGDNTVNAADIVEVVNAIMGNPSEGFDESAADVNGDGVVNAADIVAIVNIIMKV